MGMDTLVCAEATLVRLCEAFRENGLDIVMKRLGSGSVLGDNHGRDVGLRSEFYPKSWSTAQGTVFPGIVEFFYDDLRMRPLT